MFAVHFVSAGLLMCVSSASGAPGWHREAADIMGTRVVVELHHPEAAQAQALIDQVLGEMRRLDAALSPYKPDSELSKLNQRAAQGWVQVSAELYRLVEQSIKMSRLTNGAFDITFASVGRFYDYREEQAPPDEQIAAMVEAINYAHIELDPSERSIRYANPHVYIDLGGIAKGYAVDRGAALLVAAGVTQASVSAGGDSVIVGDRGGQPWTVGIKHPRKEGQMAAILPLEDTAVSTSGDYERFFEKDGVRFHHILDPSTGRSAKGAWSVTILGPQGILTDALSTSVFVLGPEQGLALIDTIPGVDAIVIDPTGNLRFSADLAQLAPGS